MSALSAWKTLQRICAFGIAMSTLSHAQIFKTVATFAEVNGRFPDGSYPLSVTQGTDGSLYGTAAHGGDYFCGGDGDGFCGTVFRATLIGDISKLHDFGCCAGGVLPEMGLVLGLNGDLYGTTSSGPARPRFCERAYDYYCGSIFEISNDGVFTDLYDSCTLWGCPLGARFSSLTQAADGNFYGTDNLIFKMSPDGRELSTVQVLCHRDGCPYGSYPRAFIQSADGNFYGANVSGGDYGRGTIVKMTPEGELSVLHSFNGIDGWDPGTLLEGNDGNLYGTTSSGGTTHNGTIFKLTKDGHFTVLHGFCETTAACRDGIAPIGLIQATDGNLYGLTRSGGDVSRQNPGSGTLFMLSTEGVFKVLYSFTTPTYGPIGGVTQDTNGLLYGTNVGPCNFLDCGGSIFSFDAGLAPFAALIQSSGRVGQTGGILGQGFSGTTGVSFNGVAAAFTVVSDTYLLATVPPGATTGYVTVTTPSSTLTSNKAFTVRH